MRRRFRYSLRILIVAIAVVAAWLAWFVVPAVQQREAVAHFQDKGGMVFYEYQCDEAGVLLPHAERYRVKPRGPRWLRRLSGVDLFNKAVVLDLSAVEVRDEDLGPLGDLPRLQSLVFLRGTVSQAGLAHVGRLKSLKRLYFIFTDIDDAGLAHIAALGGLERLALKGPITDDGLTSLAGLKKLRSLILFEMEVTGQGLAHLAGLASLETLSVRIPTLTDNALEHLSSLKNLRLLHLYGKTSVTHDGVGRLIQQIPALKIVRPNVPFPQEYGFVGGIAVQVNVSRDSMFPTSSMPSDWDTHLVTLLSENTGRAASRLGVLLLARSATVRHVEPDTPAELAGLKNGDVIVKADGVALAGRAAQDHRTVLNGIVGRKELGGTVLLEIDRGGRKQEIKVILDGDGGR